MPSVYAEQIKENFSVDIKLRIRSNKKWSDRMREYFLSQGSQWNEDVEQKVKAIVANAIPERITNINDVIIEQKSGFLTGLVMAVESMLNRD